MRTKFSSVACCISEKSGNNPVAATVRLPVLCPALNFKRSVANLFTSVMLAVDRILRRIRIVELLEECVLAARSAIEGPIAANSQYPKGGADTCAHFFKQNSLRAVLAALDALAMLPEKSPPGAFVVWTTKTGG